MMALAISPNRPGPCPGVFIIRIQAGLKTLSMHRILRPCVPDSRPCPLIFASSRWWDSCLSWLLAKADFSPLHAKAASTVVATSTSARAARAFEGVPFVVGS